MNALAHSLSTGLPDPFAHGKLVPGVHSTLVAELDRVAAEAGISPRDVTGADYALTDFEREYLREFRRTPQTGKLGIIYIGAQDPPVVNRCRSICGALLRNFIDARFITREELVSDLFDNRRQPRASLVAVPDFSYQDAPVSTRRALLSWLSGRAARGAQTVIGLPYPGAMLELFGAETPLYKKHFAVLNGVITPA